MKNTEKESDFQHFNFLRVFVRALPIARPCFSPSPSCFSLSSPLSLPPPPSPALFTPPLGAPLLLSLFSPIGEEETERRKGAMELLEIHQCHQHSGAYCPIRQCLVFGFTIYNLGGTPLRQEALGESGRDCWTFSSMFLCSKKRLRITSCFPTYRKQKCLGFLRSHPKQGGKKRWRWSGPWERRVPDPRWETGKAWGDRHGFAPSLSVGPPCLLPRVGLSSVVLLSLSAGPGLALPAPGTPTLSLGPACPGACPWGPTAPHYGFCLCPREKGTYPPSCPGSLNLSVPSSAQGGQALMPSEGRPDLPAFFCNMCCLNSSPPEIDLVLTAQEWHHM